MIWRRGPIRRTRSGVVIDLSDDERALLGRLLTELNELLESDSPLVRRLFPAAYPDDPEREAEYQRLMRSELVVSRRSAIEVVNAVLERGHTDDEGELLQLMQSLNSLRLVLGTMLDVTDDPTGAEVSTELEGSGEHQLYQFLSWLLDAAVTAASTVRP